MSGIFGFLYRDGRFVEPGPLDCMSERLMHRGPDGSGIWHSGSVGLGHRLLHTTPESLAENWPIVHGGGDLVLVADARIDNRDELVRSLDLRQPEQTLTDGDLILAAYRKWGRSASEKLIGDFAFAIWDANRRALFCARDPMAVKPFYYYVSDRLFAFASEIKGLFCLPEIPRVLDEVQIAYFLDWFRSDQERTMYQGIRRLPASRWLEVGPENVHTGTHWTADPKREIRFSTDEQYVEAFREHFMEAVRSRLRSAFPVGSALSGGLDSSSIVATARRLMDPDRPLHVISAAFPGLPEPYRQWNDESRFIDPVARVEGIVSHQIRADERDVFEYLDRMFWFHDAPPFGFMYWMRWAVYEAAHDQGIRVFFSGDDGDTVVSHGYERFNDLALEGRWKTAVDEVAAIGRRSGSSPEFLSRTYLNPRLVALARARRWKRWREGSREIARSYDRSALKIMFQSAFDAFMRQWLVDKSRRFLGRRPVHSVMNGDFVRRVDLEGRKREFQTNHPDPIPRAREAHAFVLPSSMLQHIMEVTDSIGAAFSIETRCPFLDRRLIEFSLAIPIEQKLAEGWTRLILRRAMEGILPPEVQWRLHKADLAYNFVRRLQGQDRRALSEALFAEPQVLADYLNMDRLRSLHERFHSNGLRGARNSSAHLYTSAVLARWLRSQQPESPSQSPALSALRA